MRPCEDFCCLTHQMDIRLFSEIIDITPLKYLFDFSGGDPVNINFPGGIQSAVKTLRNFCHFGYGNIFRQITVQILFHFLWIDLFLQMYICHLLFCMHPRIRASGSLDLHFFPAHFGQNRFDFSLNGGFGTLLSLPSFVACSIILN